MKQVLFFVFVATVYSYALAQETTWTPPSTWTPTPPTPPTPRFPWSPMQMMQQGFAAMTGGLKTGMDMVQKIDDTIMGVNQQPASGFMPNIRG